MTEEYLFEIRDKLGRITRWRKAVFIRHLPEHPEISGYIEEAKITLQDPDYILENENTEEMQSLVYYRMGLGRQKFETCFLKVPVYYDKAFSPEEGEVATAHFTRRVGRGKLIWRRS